MKSAPALVIALVIALFSLGHAPTARADATASQPPPTASGATAAEPDYADDPGCVTKRPGALCAMPDGTGGVCSIVRCTGDRPCLHCKSGPVNSPEGSAYYLLIIVGVLVSVGGTILVMRLRKYWK